MSSSTATVISCDIKECNAEETFMNQTQKRAREQAQEEHGWFWIPEIGDVCPDHTIRQINFAKADAVDAMDTAS